MKRDKDKTIKYYKEKSVVENYDTIRFSCDVGKYCHEREIIAILRNLPSLISLRVLDVGAGTGRIGLELAKRNAKVIALDTSKGMLNKLKFKMKNSMLEIDTIVADAEYIPFKGNVFDVVVSTDTLNHIHNYKQVLREICRVSSGYVAVSVPYLTSVLAPIPLFINPLRKIIDKLPTFNRYFLPTEIINVLKDNGLVVYQKGLFSIPPRILSYTMLPYALLKIVEKYDVMGGETFLKHTYAVQLTIGKKNE